VSAIAWWTMRRRPASRAPRRGRPRSVRARTTLVATAAVAVVLVAAVAALAYAVEQTLVRRVQEHAEAEVQAVTDRLATGMPPTEALRPVSDPDLVGGNVFTYVAVLDHEGHPVADSGFFAIAGVVEVGVTVSGERNVVSVGSPDLAIAQRTIEVDGELLLVVAASPLAEAVHSVDAIVRTSMVGVPLLIVLVGAVTWMATGRTLRPIDSIRTEVDQLSSRTLDRRVPVPDTDDEVARLARTMNRMLERLQDASARQREFVSDASHELRSPVASIRAELEVTLAHPDASNWREAATSALTETGRIERIVEGLLLLARLEEGATLAASVVDVGQLVRDTAGRVGDTAVNVQVTDGLLVRGRNDDLTSVVRNLVDNAVRHASSTVTVTAAAGDGTVVITVDDDGPGIPPADRGRVFQRFTRLDPARSHPGGDSDGGVGLGLAVVDRVVRHHHGSVSVTESPAGGARFTVALPADHPPPPGWCP
jgi:signal transduction histidine kinase